MVEKTVVTEGAWNLKISPITHVFGRTKVTNEELFKRYVNPSTLHKYDAQNKGTPVTQNYTPDSLRHSVGVANRFFAEEESIVDLAARCIRQLPDYGHKTDIILSTSSDPKGGHLLNATDTELFAIPKKLSSKLAIKKRRRVNVTMKSAYCAGFLIALMEAAKRSKELSPIDGKHQRVIACTAEKLSDFFFKREYESKDCTLFGDGAAAVRIEYVQDKEEGSYTLFGKHIYKEDTDRNIHMNWRAPDGKPLIALSGGRDVIRKASTEMIGCLEQVCAFANMTLADLDFIGPHLGSTVITQKNCKLALDKGANPEAINEKYLLECLLNESNTGGVTSAARMKYALEQGKKNIGITAIGAGYNIASIVLCKN